MGKGKKSVSRIVKIEAAIGKITGEAFDREKDFFGLGEAWIPVVNISENENSIKVVAELPGVAEDDIHLLLRNNRLEIKGKKKETPAGSKVRYLRLEREHGPFRRFVILPSAVDSENIRAVLANGILTIVFKKFNPKKQREIVFEIKSNRRKKTEDKDG